MRFPVWLAGCLLLCTSCGEDSVGGAGVTAGAASGDKAVVLTTFYPTTYFASRIAGQLVDVRCPLPADADPIFWKPSPEALAAYQAADLIIVNGAELEKWIEQVTLPASRVVNTAAGFRDQWIHFEGTTHSHGPEGEHSHVGVDGHTWLDPLLAVRQSRTIADALIRLRPESTAEIEAGFASLEKDLQELHAAFAALGEQADGESLYASHPAYNYLRERYGWRVVNLDLDPEAMPTPETLAELTRQLQRRRGRYLLWEAEPEPAIADALQQLGLQSVVVSPCEAAPASGAGDYLEQMRASVVRLAAAFDTGK